MEYIDTVCMPSDCAVRIIRSVISPRLAIRILLKGGCFSTSDAAVAAAADVDENVRFDTMEMLLRAARPSRAARSNNSLGEDIFVNVY